VLNPWHVVPAPEDRVKRLRGYIFGRPFLGERVPQHVQNIVLRDYARRRGVSLLLAASEYAMPGSHLILETVCGELPRIDGILAYSVFQLPEDSVQRASVLDRVVSQGKEIHFAVEDIVVGSQASADDVEVLWRVRLALESTPGEVGFPVG
jgi:sporadic carbohydrate cluster protein (TIGR04323 family)